MVTTPYLLRRQRIDSLRAFQIQMTKEPLRICNHARTTETWLFAKQVARHQLKQVWVPQNVTKPEHREDRIGSKLAIDIDMVETEQIRDPTVLRRVTVPRTQHEKQVAPPKSIRMIGHGWFELPPSIHL